MDRLASTARPRRHSPSILCVDDDDDGRYLSAFCLSRAGFIVHEAADGARALELAYELCPHVLLLDLVLPLVDGWTVASRLKSGTASADIRIVAFTATVLPRDRARALDSGCDAFLEKPAAPELLVGVVRRALSNVPPLRASRPPLAG